MSSRAKRRICSCIHSAATPRASADASNIVFSATTAGTPRLCGERNLLKSAAVVLTLSLAWTVSGQDWPHPVRQLGAARAPAATRISFLRFDFQEPYFGREGPNYHAIKDEPAAGVQQFAQASIYGQEAIAGVKFEMVDETGNVIQTLHFIKTDNSPEEGEYLGMVDVPHQPFRIIASGQYVNGAPFRAVNRRLFRPDAHLAPALAFPADMPPQNAQQLRAWVEAMDKQAQAQFEEARRTHPDGTIPAPRAGVSNVTYEPFVSRYGNLLGIRVRFDIQFSADGYHALSPHVFPVYQAFKWRGEVTMKVQNESITPLPQTQNAVDPKALLRYNAAAYYKGGVAYHAVVDMVPDYVIYNVDNSRTCIYNYKFQSSGQIATWDGIRASTAPIKYRVDLNGADFQGETDPFYPQRNFYENFLKEGAVDCGPTPTNRF